MRSGGMRDRRGGGALGMALAAALLCAAPWGASALEVTAEAANGGADTGAADPAASPVPLFELRPGSPLLGAAPARGLFGPDAQAPGLLLDLHPLHNGFRLSLSPGFDRPSGLTGVDLGAGFGVAAPAAPTAVTAGGLETPWYMGLGWTGSLGGNVSLFVDVGAAYAGDGLAAAAGLPPVVFDLGGPAQDPARQADDAFSRLFPMLSVSFAYRF